MESEVFTIAIDGKEVTDLYDSLISLEAELDDELAALFRLQIAIELRPDGSWTFLDDERFQIWKPVTISAGLSDSTEELISGYITHLLPSFDPDLSECRLEVWGMDGSVLMDREEKLKDWPNKKDSDIADEIFSTYGLSPDVEDTLVVHDEAVSTIMQRESDIRFLRRLALRNGFECYVEGTSGYFRPPQLAEDPQPVLAAQFGDETNLITFALKVNGLRPAQVRLAQIDRATKGILDVSVETGQRPALGANDAAGLLGLGIKPATVVLGGSVATGEVEMTTLCQSIYDRGEWFVTGEGEIAANDYGYVLRPRRTVTIKGIGETYSGVYYVNHVTHVFSQEGYRQRFWVKRNALMPTGSETFSANA